MADTKTTWENLPSTNTPVNATNLNKIENGIKENDDKLLGNKPMGDVVVDSIRTKNMFDKNTIVAGDITGSNTGNRLSSRQVLWLEAGTYTFSCNIASPYRYGILVQNTGIPPLSSATTYIYDSGWKTASNPTTTFTINTAGWVTISFSKEDSSALTPSDVTGFNYQLEKGSTATTYRSYQNLSNEELYTTGEQRIGRWIDGKPLYRKTVTVSSINTNANSINVNHGISNMDVVASIKGAAKITGANEYRPLSCMYINDSGALDSQYLFNVYGITPSQITLSYGNWFKTRFDKAYITLEYTKTTG